MNKTKNKTNDSNQTGNLIILKLEYLSSRWSLVLFVFFLWDVEVPDFDLVVPRCAHNLRLVAVDAVNGVLVRRVALNALVPVEKRRHKDSNLS